MGLDVSFGKWLMFGIPFVIVMILIAWLLLLWLFPSLKRNWNCRWEGNS